MSVYDDNLDGIEILEVGEVQMPTIFVLDTSGSMAGTRIDELNRGMQEYTHDIKNDSSLLSSVDAAIVTFGNGGVNVHTPFTLAVDFSPPTLTAGGGTPLGAGVTMALDMVEQRKQTYKASQANYHRPWMIVMSDGGASDWQSASQRVKAMEAAKGVICMPIGIGSDADFQMLAQLSSVNQPRQLSETKLQAFFKFMSKSQRAIVESTRTGQQAASVDDDPLFSFPIDVT